MNTHERIWAFEPDIFDNMSVWQDSPSPAGDTVEYIRADLVDPLSDPRVKALVETLRHIRDGKNLNQTHMRKASAAALADIEENVK
jgi:hypothetical protein